MDDPVLVEVTRTPAVESRHRGAVAIVDDAGRVVASLGDIDRPVFPRSAVKPIQALALVESGAAETYGFGAREIALACASHAGDATHVAVAERMLAAAGLTEAALECGGHWPNDETMRTELIRSGRRYTRIHDNCSGKHSGFLCCARHLGLPTAGYVRPAHPVQERVTAALADLTGTHLGPANRGIDGCSIPSFAIPLRNLAWGFARFGTGAGLGDERRRAAARITTACQDAPDMLAGPGRFNTEAMRIAGADLLLKLGAEGVYCGALPPLGLGIAIKCEDGGSRAGDAVTAAILAALLPQHPALGAFVETPVMSRAGEPVGTIRPAVALREFAGRLEG